MKNEIRISVPYLQQSVGHTSLCVDTTWVVNGQAYEQTFHYQVEDKWGRYFVTERSDAWVLTFLEIAMEHACDLVFETPISEDLKYQLERYLIPVYVQHFDMLHEIKLVGPFTAETLPSEGVTGTGFSAGVDSFYSVLSHLHTGMPGKDVTHLVLAVNGAASTGMTEEMDEDWYQEEVGRFKPLAEEMGLELIGIRSNITLLSNDRAFYLGGDAIVTLAFIHALSKLFGTYYWASAYRADILRFDTHDGGYMEPFVLPILGVRSGVHFYHSGSETNRVGKVRFIADDPVAQKGLTVCGQDIDRSKRINCGRCVKCLRTMAELTAVGKLDKFDKVFPVADYKAHFSSRLADELALDHPPFTTDITATLRENGVHIPFTVFVKKYLWYKPYYFAKKKLRNNRFMMELYYGTGLGKKLSGIEHDERHAEARMKNRF